MKVMTILVTGATGLIGGHLVNRLLDDGIRVRVLARPTSDTRALEARGIEVIRGDFRDKRVLKTAVAGADIVFHVAGYVSALGPFTIGEGNGRQWATYQAVNVEFTQSLLAASHAAGVGRFLFVSSSSVYSPDVPIPTPETAELRPLSLYGRSKLLAEAAVNEYQQRGLPTTIVRPSIVYGPGDRTFTPLALRLARLPVLPLVNGSRQRFDLIYAADVANLLWTAAQHPGATGHVYNAGPGQPTSLYDLIAAYRQLTGRGPRILPIPPKLIHGAARLLRPAMRPFGSSAANLLSEPAIALLYLDLHLDMRRAAEELNFYPQYTLSDGLAQTIRTGFSVFGNTD